MESKNHFWKRAMESKNHFCVSKSCKPSYVRLCAAKNTENENQGQQEKEKGQVGLLVTLVVVMIASQTSFMNVAALLPTYAGKHHPSLNSTMIGTLLSAYQVTFLFVAPLIGSYMGTIGRKNCIGYGIVIVSFATLIFALAVFCKDDWWFWTISCIARGIQGIADAMVIIAIPSIVSMEFPDKNEVYQGYCNMALGAGFTIGPALAAVVIRWFGYMGTFIFFSAATLAYGLVGVALIPDRINNVERSASSD